MTSASPTVPRTVKKAEHLYPSASPKVRVPYRSHLTILAQQLEQLFASLLTATARLRADAAMLVHLSVLFALVTARFTSDSTRLELRPQQLRIGFGLTRKNLAGCVTNASAV